MPRTEGWTTMCGRQSRASVKVSDGLVCIRENTLQNEKKQKLFLITKYYNFTVYECFLLHYLQSHYIRQLLGCSVTTLAFPLDWQATLNVSQQRCDNIIMTLDNLYYFRFIFHINLPIFIQQCKKSKTKCQIN